MDQRRMCPHCRAFITTKDRVCPYCNETVGPRAIERRDPSPVMSFIPHARFNTMLILMINFGLYIVMALYSSRVGDGSAMRLGGEALGRFGAAYGPLIETGQWWRLVTAGFLHRDIIHILMNSWVLFDLGAQVEEIYGTSRMWVIYLLSSIAGFYLSTTLRPIASVGASAALFGLIGAMIALGVRHRSALGGAIRGMYTKWAVYGLVFSLLPGIDMAAHLGGLGAGFVIGYAAGSPRYEGSWAERAWRIAAWLCVIVTAVAFIKMYSRFAAQG